MNGRGAPRARPRGRIVAAGCGGCGCLFLLVIVVLWVIGTVAGSAPEPDPTNSTTAATGPTSVAPSRTEPVEATSSTTPAAQDSSAPRASALTTSPAAPTTGAWAGAPSDGTWEYGDVSFGDWTPEISSADHVYRVSGPPTMTTDDNGATVTITSPLEAKRVRDLGYGEKASDVQAVFMPGEPAKGHEWDEDYGERTTVSCESDVLPVNGSTSCTVSFVAPSSEVPDFHWMINRSTVGAWPSQEA